ncbi:ABC transporter substrate-binding protein [Methylobacterium isbiliense]|jgi:branched-chain amino acid transport system substrate-binding protein|uniref:Leucine-, isoleucine-, valine-, threonine-, and alanine-binding protein n=1 Tax=Methylobacterium isbiliense TaxID=315478 RepID=A0ABQ4SPR7_9HYPH|nr:ABC transporter substrate-binding protein [Methylobacterium isbiliense]MDN3627255.1 ABC transporter substrate-binding protein [Methylobacterium isbiliense]GJE04495.1 Leucine-, isoleucine-, valine-, threonine-, and alanine-binding protein [Methylobacterium isbiliense]
MRVLSKLMLAAAMLAGTVAGANAQDKTPVKLGAIEILTGPNSRYGIAIQRGFDLALADINKAGGVLGGRPLALAYEDSAGAKEQALNAARKLIGRDRVPLILGPTLSNEMFAAGPVANERKVPIVGTSTTANGITAIGPYVFRTAMPEADVIPVTLKTAQSKFGIKRVAVMYGNDDAFTKSAYDVMKATLEKLGIQVLTTETFGSKDTDFSAQLTKIKGLNPDAIVLSALVEAASGIALQARQLGIDPKVFIIGGNGLNSPKLGEIAGASADGTIVGSPWFIGKKDPANQAFVTAFREKYGDSPDQFAAQAYDTLFIVAKAIDAAGAPDSEKIKDALIKVKHTGVMGPFSFSESRDPADTSGVVVLTMKGGKFQLLE